MMILTTVTNLDITQISEYKQHYFFSSKPEIFSCVTLALQNSFCFLPSMKEITLKLKKNTRSEQYKSKLHSIMI